MGIFQFLKGNVAVGEERRHALRMFLLACASVVALCIGISLLFYQVYKSSLTNESISASARMLDRTDMMISEAFGQIENIAYQQALATARLINESDRDIVHDYYRLQRLTDSVINMKNSYSYIHSAYVYFNQGSVIVTSFMGTTSFRLFYDTAWLEVYGKHAGEIVWINGRKPYNAQYEGSQDVLAKYHDDTSDILTLLVPLSNSLRSKGGVIVINVYEREIAKLLSEGANGAEMLMMDESGRVVVSANKDLLYTALPEALFTSISGSGSDSGNFHYRDEASGGEYLCVYARSRFNQNYILELLPLSEVLAPTAGLLRSIILYALLFLIAALVLVMVLLNLSYRPVRQLYRELGKSVSVPVSDANPAALQRTIMKLIQDNRTLTKLWENNRMLIKHRNLSILLQGKMSAFDDDPKRLEFLEIRFPYRYYVCCVLHLGAAQHSNIILDEQYELVKMQLFPMVQQCLTPPIWGYTVDLDDLNVALILNVADSNPGLILNLCQQIQKIALDSKIIPFPLSIGIGSHVTELGGISLSFRQACSAVRYAAGNYPGEVISFSSISVSPLLVEWSGSPEESELLDAIRIGDLAAARSSLERWFENLRRAGLPLAVVKQIASKQAGQILGLLSELRISIGSSNLTLTGELPHMSSLDDIKARVLDLSEHICSQIQIRREHKNAETLEKVIAFLRQSYNQDISLNQVAEDVYMSVPYLCKVFKEYTGTTFTDYLTTLRIEASLPLLRDSNRKVMDIASCVGYSNVQSYIRAFKKIHSMTPSEYRESNIPHNLR